MNMITEADASYILLICSFFWAFEKIFKLIEYAIESGVIFLRSLPDKRSSRSSSEERDDSSELPEDINSSGHVSPSKANPEGFVFGNK